jgi:hypothetical protein
MKIDDTVINNQLYEKRSFINYNFLSPKVIKNLSKIYIKNKYIKISLFLLFSSLNYQAEV